MKEKSKQQPLEHIAAKQKPRRYKPKELSVLDSVDPCDICNDEGGVNWVEIIQNLMKKDTQKPTDSHK